MNNKINISEMLSTCCLNDSCENCKHFCKNCLISCLRPNVANCSLAIKNEVGVEAAWRTLAREVNSMSDTTGVYVEEGYLSGGSFVC